MAVFSCQRPARLTHSFYDVVVARRLDSKLPLSKKAGVHLHIDHLSSSSLCTTIPYHTTVFAEH